MTPYDLDPSSSSSDNDEGWNPSREVMRIALRSNLNITTHDRRPIDKAATLQALEQKEELLRSDLESRPDRVDPGNGPPSARTPSAARSQQDWLKSLTQQRESEADILEAIRRGYQDDIQRRTASRIDSIKGQARKKKKGKKRQTERASFLKGGTKRREPPSYGAGKIGPPPPPAPTLMMDDGGATTNSTRRRPQPRFPEPYDSTCLVAPLHSNATAGVDTCSGYSVSTYPEDFATLDRSPEACGSVSIKGIGSSDEGSTTGGRGAMAIPCVDADNNPIMMVDPEGVYIEKGANEPAFRVFAQLRMKRFGLHLVQGWSGEHTDVLKCQKTGRIIPLSAENGILVLRLNRHGRRINGNSILPDIMAGRSSAAVDVIRDPSGPQ